MALQLQGGLQRRQCGSVLPRRGSSLVAISPVRRSVTALATAAAPTQKLTGEQRSHETDVVVIGSGIGGLSCAAMLAKYGYQVTVCESHTIPGGAAHTWERDGYHFESGPSLYSGLDSRGPAANPLSHVYSAIGEGLELKRYNTWNVIVPEGTFLTKIGDDDNFPEVLATISGQAAVAEWRRLLEAMKPLSKAAAAIPPTAFRFDPGVLITAILRYLPALLTTGADAAKLTGPFSKVIDGLVTDKFLRNWLDLLCFLLAGLPSDGIIAAEVAYMFGEWYRPGTTLDFPVGGSQAMVDALIRGLEKKSGRLLLASHVSEVMVEGGRATGVKLRGGGTIKARKAVVSNASVWDTLNMLPGGPSTGGQAAAQQAGLPDLSKWREERNDTPACPSFMHLHVGFDATGLPEDLELHHIVVKSWEGGVTAPQNVVLISIPSVKDPSMAPAGKHCLHAYFPATEPYELWEGLDRRSPEYKALKEQRAEALWAAVEKVIPDIRKRAEVSFVGTPLTHERFLRRHRGSYGPAIRAGEALFPGPVTPVPGLMVCGDSTFPGIGLPAVAASGAICANTLAPIWKHWQVLEDIGA